MTHTAITPTPDLPLSPTTIALSPDGQTLAMTAGNQIVLRRLDNTKLAPLPGTEGGSNLFFSPDGNWVGFVAPYWAADDVIYFGARGQGLFRVPATGGAPTSLTQPRRDAGEISHQAPQMLDDGRTVLFTLIRADGRLPALLDVASGEWRAIPGINSDFARYAPSGHLLYRQGKSVFAVTMSLASATTTGTPEALFDGVLGDENSALATSADGTLAYLPNSIAIGNQGRIVIVSRSGTVTSVVNDSVALLIAASSGLRLSPDAGSIVAAVQSAPNTSDLWVYDLGRGARTKLTDQVPINGNPAWSPDGSRVQFHARAGGRLHAVRRRTWLGEAPA